MKSERILNTLSQVDEKYIAEAAPVKKAEKKSGWLKWGALAACFVMAVYAGMHFIPVKTPDGNLLESSDRAEGGISSEFSNRTEGGFSPELPMLTITENVNAEGFEGYMAYDISELINANPWSKDAELTTLPVYRNLLSYDNYYIVSGADFEAMRAFLLEIADRLGMDMDKLKIRDDTPSPEQQEIILEKTGGDIPEGYFNPTAVIAEENGIKIEVDAVMTATITFDPAFSIPDGYTFTHYSSYEDVLAVAEYLKDTYHGLLGMEHSQINIYGGEYNIYRQQMYHIGFYSTNEAQTEQIPSDTLTEEILNYNFRQTVFYCDDEGKLWMVRIFNPDLSGKIGDYPVISTAEATELLQRGNYITTVPYEMPGKEYIAGVELVYRTGKYEECYIPYYRFYVEMPELEGEDGLKDYGAYYVPAVQKEYIANMPLWDGSFNR